MLYVLRVKTVYDVVHHCSCGKCQSTPDVRATFRICVCVEAHAVLGASKQVEQAHKSLTYLRMNSLNKHSILTSILTHCLYQYSQGYNKEWRGAPHCHCSPCHSYSVPARSQHSTANVYSSNPVPLSTVSSTSDEVKMKLL